jgi:hypothetical protein
MSKFLIISLLILLLASGCLDRGALYELATIEPTNTLEAPFIIGTDPGQDQTQIPENTLVAVLFSVPMDTSSLETSFRISYGGQEYDISDGNALWSYNDRLFIFRQFAFIPIAEQVIATVDSTAQSNTQNSLNSIHDWSFTVAASAFFGSPVVLSSQPLYDAIVPVDTAPTIEFDRDMLRTSVVSSFLLMSDDFQDVKTAEDGDFVWSNREVTFQPFEPLAHDKYYTMSLNGNGVVCRDLSGNELFLFETKFFTESE